MNTHGGLICSKKTRCSVILYQSNNKVQRAFADSIVGHRSKACKRLSLTKQNADRRHKPRQSYFRFLPACEELADAARFFPPPVAFTVDTFADASLPVAADFTFALAFGFVAPPPEDLATESAAESAKFLE